MNAGRLWAATAPDYAVNVAGASEHRGAQLWTTVRRQVTNGKCRDTHAPSPLFDRNSSLFITKTLITGRRRNKDVRSNKEKRSLLLSLDARCPLSRRGFAGFLNGRAPVPAAGARSVRRLSRRPTPAGEKRRSGRENRRKFGKTPASISL